LTSDDKKALLARYRLQQAEETFDEAVYLLIGNKNPRSIINRLYYSMFYAVLALMVYEQYTSSKHSGVLSYFNRHFIKEGMFTKETGRAINEAFELRISSDYGEYVVISKEQIEPYIEKTREFINNVREYLKKEKFTSGE
jgi:uncharacterized protein (UPF0332 family)